MRLSRPKRPKRQKRLKRPTSLTSGLQRTQRVLIILQQKTILMNPSDQVLLKTILISRLMGKILTARKSRKILLKKRKLVLY